MRDGALNSNMFVGLMLSLCVSLTLTACIDLVNDTDLSCRVCNSQGGGCFSLSTGNEMAGVEKTIAPRDGKLYFLCSSDEASESGVEHVQRELHQGVIGLSDADIGANSREIDGKEVLLMSSFYDSSQNGKNMFVHVQDKYHRGNKDGVLDEFDGHADFEGKSRADSLLSVVHAKVDG